MVTFYDIVMFSDTVIDNRDAAHGDFFVSTSEIGGFGRADNSINMLLDLILVMVRSY